MTERRVAVVTGANRGIGHEIAAQLTAAGGRVVATAREPGPGEIRLDVTCQDEIDALARGLNHGFDILVNNAAILLRGLSAEIARRTLDVNFFGALHTTDGLLPWMRPHGRIVMVSSGMGALANVGPRLRKRFENAALDRNTLIDLMESFVRDVAGGVHEKNGWPSSAYSVSKVGLNALTRVLAHELGGDPRSILVNAADPGWVRTRMGGRGAPRSPRDGARTPVWLALLPTGGPNGGFFRDERSIPW
jgi:carbonyl reductase 1